MIDSYLKRFRKIVMLMKKYPIRSSATKIESLDGSGALPQETLEYLEIQPPAELCCLGRTWIMKCLGIKRLAPHQRFRMSFCRKKQKPGRQENERSRTNAPSCLRKNHLYQ